LTEVTASVLERVDGLALAVVKDLLKSDSPRRGGADSQISALIREQALAATDALSDPRASISTQITTPKGRFVDLEIWLRPRRPTEQSDDVRVWIEAKHGSGVHGDQLDAYIADIETYPARHRLVLLLLPRGQELATPPPPSVAVVEWQTISKLVSGWQRDAACSAKELWLLDEYARYLYEEGLMEPEALDTAYALALMEANDAEAAMEAICEYAAAVIGEQWGETTECAMVGRASPKPNYGLRHWAKHLPATANEGPANTWLGGWFEWGVRNTDELEDLDDPRGSYVFYAGASFEAKANPSKVVGNETWVNARLSEGFLRSSFYWHRLVRLKYPDELLAQTTVEDQGRVLGEWVVRAFRDLATNVPPH
jgi:hypothetical protein